MIKLKSLIPENYQLGMKIYGSVLTPEDINFLSRLSEKDYTFKTLADLLMEERQGYELKWSNKNWEDAVAQLRQYNTNFLPIEGFSFDSRTPTVTKRMLTDRLNCILELSKWPKTALRNLRKDIRIPRKDFHYLSNTLHYINAYLSYLDNKSEPARNSIYRKVFSSEHPSFESIRDFVEDKKNLLSGTAYTKEELYDIVKKNDYDLEIIYDKGNIVIIDVKGQPGIKAIGCNSLWCFTYGSEYGKAGEQWEIYSRNDHVYAIIDFNQSQDSPEFVHILTKPFDEQTDDESYLYDMSNEQTYGRAESTILRITRDKSVLDLFKFEEDY